MCNLVLVTLLVAVAAGGKAGKHAKKDDLPR
jgi:hypothetical protein